MVRKPKGSLGLVPTHRRIVLKGDAAPGLFEQELRGAEVTGVLRNHRTARTCNIVESALHSFTAESADFTHCDFKDSSIRSCRFRDCGFGSSSWAYDTVMNSAFENCSFPDSDMQNCEFEQTSFVRCDLRNLLVKGCTFSRCEFRECQTNNKVFETCRLTECSFRDTELQAHTIAENFGLKIADFKGILRDDRLDRPHQTLSPDDLELWVEDNATHPLQKLSIEYFLNKPLLSGSSCLDACLNIASWLPAFRTAGSFAIVLNRWADFLLWLYEQDQLPVHTLIRLHSMTDGLVRALGDRRSQQQALATISGTHLLIARPVEQYLTLLEQCALSGMQHVTLLVEGHQTKAYYYRALAPLFTRGSARITHLVRHNSPWDLGVAFGSGSSALFFMGLFLATRTRIEVFRIARKIEHQTPETINAPTKATKRSKKKAATTASTPESIMSLDFGGSRALRPSPNFRIKAYLPGNLIAELRLDVSSKQIGKLRKTLKDLL